MTEVKSITCPFCGQNIKGTKKLGPNRQPFTTIIKEWECKSCNTKVIKKSQ